MAPERSDAALEGKLEVSSLGNEYNVMTMSLYPDIRILGIPTTVVSGYQDTMVGSFNS